MRFCGECGQTLKEEALFCPECGSPTPVKKKDAENDARPVEAQVEVSSSMETQPNNKTEVPVSPATRNEPKKPMPKKQKLMFGIIAVVALALFSIYQLGNSLSSIDRLLNHFEEAVYEGDGGAVAKLLVSNDSRLKINEEAVEPFMRFLDENPSFIGNVMSELRSQEMYILNSDEKIMEVGYGYGPLRLKKDGKTALFFDRYKLEIKAEYVEFYSRFPGTVVSLNGEEVGTVTDDYFEYGPIIPGIHQMEAVYEGEYTDLTMDQTFILMNTDYMAEIFIHFDEIYVDFYSNFHDGELYLNGQSLGVKLNELDIFGPLNRTDKVTFHLERDFPWGRVKSNEVQLEEYEYYYDLYINPVTEGLKEELIRVVNEHNKETIEVYKAHDAGLYSHATEYYKDWLQSYLDYYKNWDYDFVGKGVVSSEFDLDSIDVYMDEDTYYAYLIRRNTIMGDYLNLEYADEEDIALTEQREDVETNTVYFVYNQEKGQWFIDHQSNYYGFDENNTVKKEYH